MVNADLADFEKEPAKNNLFDHRDALILAIRNPITCLIMKRGFFQDRQAVGRRSEG